MHTNGLGRATIGMSSIGFRRSMTKHLQRTDERLEKAADDPQALAYIPHPDQLGMGMVLEARGNVYGDVRTVDPAVVAKRRARNKAARRARKAARR